MAGDVTVMKQLAAGSTDAPGTINLAAVLGALRRRKRVVLASLLAVNAAAVALVLLIPPRYTATATLAIEAAVPRVFETQPVARQLPAILPGDSSVLATQVNLLRSWTLATDVVVALGLDRDPPPPRISDRLAGLARDWLPTSWRAMLGIGDDPGKSASPDTLRQMAVSRFLDRLSINQQGDSRIIAVSFTASAPDQAARVANEMVARFLDKQLAMKSESTARALRWAEARAAQLQKELLTAETAVTDYMAAHGLTRAAEGGLDLQQLTALQSELAKAGAERAAKEAKLTQLRELATHPGGYESLPEVGSSRLITALQQQAAALSVQEAQLVRKFGPEHLSVLQIKDQRNALTSKIRGEVENIAHGLENEAMLAGSRERALEAALARGKAQYAATERASLPLRELTRAATTKRTLYELLLARTSEIREQAALLEPDAFVVSAASVPVKASFPNVEVFLIAGFVSSLALGALLAALREHFDRGLRTPRQIERLLGLPNLGLIPTVARRRHPKRLHGVVLEKPQSIYAESIRAINTTLQARSAMPWQVLLVTSSLPGEGKTTLAASLAAAGARAGRSVVLVDLDLRHPSVARELNIPVKAGIVELLEGGCTLDDALLAHPGEARLHVLPISRPAASPGDLLVSPELRTLIADLCLRHDIVLLDLPPALGLSDVQAVGSLADVVLLVVRWGATSAAAAVNAVEALTRVGVTVTGTALTQVDLRKYALYGHDDGGKYYKRYSRYFKED